MLDTTILDIRTKTPMGMLVLDAIKGIGPTTLDKVMARFDTLGALLDADDAGLKGTLNTKQAAAVRDGPQIDRAYRAAVKETERADELGARLVGRFDDDYPATLLAVEEPPNLLTVSGDISMLDACVAVIGTDNPTKFGRAVTHRMSAALAENGWGISTGLGEGVDTIAQDAAIDRGGRVCAVFACGLDRFDSRDQMFRAKRIFETGGLLVSDKRFGTDTDIGPRRDRDKVVTGVSLSTFMMQGMMRVGTNLSDATHGARYSLVHGRPIYAPRISDDFRQEPLNHMAWNLANMPARDFVKLAGWETKVLEAIAHLGNAPAAEEIKGMEDFHRILAQLDRLRPQPALAMAM
jgi:DNA processing protein